MIRKILTHIIMPAIIAISCTIVVNLSFSKKSLKEIEEGKLVEYAKGYIQRDINENYFKIITYTAEQINDDYYIVEVYCANKFNNNYTIIEYIVNLHEGKYYIEGVD